MVSFGTNTCKSANMADNVSGKYYTVSIADTRVHMHVSDKGGSGGTLHLGKLVYCKQQ